MYTAATIEPIRFEFIRSLVEETYDLLEKLPVKMKARAQKAVFNAIKTVSPAAIELWVVAVNEWFYFQDMLAELESSTEDFTEFRKAAAEMIRNDFGAEDFRYYDLEKARDKKTFAGLIVSYIKELEKTFLTSRKELFKLKKQNYSGYLFYKKSPMEQGTGVKPVFKKTPAAKIKQIIAAEKILKEVWPEGHRLFKILTDRIHLVKSDSLVSYSHFHEPGISYINILDRGLLDTVDDLVHENAHHHLNLLLKKYSLIAHKENDPVYYSPWRRTLRPLYGIFHAVFTFTYGAELFRQIVQSKTGLLTAKDLDWARFRFCEEVLKNEYSLTDLENTPGYFTGKGKGVVAYLRRQNNSMKKSYDRVYQSIQSREFLKELEQLQKLLAASAEKYR